MLALPEVALADEANRTLAIYQAEVDSAGQYPDRVLAAKRLFSQRSSNSTFRVVRRTLSQMCSGAQRCAYCEDSVGDEVEHIRPKDLFPDQVFVWENYILACGPCNNGKSNRFEIFVNDIPVNITRRRSDPVVEPPAGAAIFIDPRREDPLRYFDLDINGTFIILTSEELAPLDQHRAQFTIDTLKLNRDVLLAARGSAFGSYHARLFEYVKKRDEGYEIAELRRLVEGIRSMPHPTVWAEMRRKRNWRDDLADLFERAPEALQW